MNTRLIILLIVLSLSIEAVYSSEIMRITLSELESRAEIIVLGQVTEVLEDGDRDLVTIQAGSYLKGPGDREDYTFLLISRGGLKDFDPSLEEGDTGVFFLKLGDDTGRSEKAYWGSIAVFPNNNFEVSD